MQGTGMTVRGRIVAAGVALFASLAMFASLNAGGAGASDGARAFSFDCDHDAIHVTQQRNRLDARGRLKCTGSGIRRQILRVCLLQTTRRNPVLIKCVTKARNGTGLLTARASRRCGVGPATGFITRVQVRIKQTDGDVVTDKSTASPNRFGRDCTS